MSLDILIRNIGGFPYDYESIAIDQSDYDSLRASIWPLLRSSDFVVLDKLDASELDPDAIREWLRTLPFTKTVTFLSFSFAGGVRIDYDCFVSFYDDLWYPSRDDGWVVDDALCYLLDLDHEEQFTLYRLKSGPALGKGHT